MIRVEIQPAPSAQATVEIWVRDRLASVSAPMSRTAARVRAGHYAAPVVDHTETDTAVIAALHDRVRQMLGRSA